MTKTKSTKRALLLSALSLLLCISMLVGSTFAWFTDSVTSGNNKIVAGTLDVEMYWAYGTETPDDTANWTDASTGAIFDYDLWEPGYTEVRHIKIENVGSLALQYQLAITPETAADAELAKVIDVYYLDPAQKLGDRAELPESKKIGTLNEVLNAMADTASGNLKHDEEVIITLALKMQETAGNEYQGKSIGTSFEIKLFATQLDYEKDSFDETYDKDLKPLEEGEVLEIVDGIQYVYTPEGENYLYLVPEDYASDTVVVPEGVTNIGNYAFAYNSNVKNVVLSSSVRDLGRGFDSSAVEKVVLNEGLEEISSRAFRSTPNLQEVQISSTVKVIEDNAFQKSGIKNIVIPATVETVGEAAFGSSKIESVTFEGNTSIQGYAFRGCPNLRTVTLNGDDNTFIPSTLNGRNSMWFCNGESNNPNTSNITFYVQNETVAARVKTAMGAEAGNIPVIIDQDVFVSVKNAAELQNALNAATNDTIISLTADINGNATVTQKAGVDITINGNGNKFTGILTTFGAGNQTGTETLTIENINFVAVDGADSCIVSPDRAKNNLYSYAHNVTVKNCTFTDPTGGFDCAAIRHEDGGDKNWTVIGCSVDNTMHSMLQVNNVIGKLVVDNCTVNSKNGLNLNSSTNVELSNNVIDVLGYAVRFGTNSNSNPTEAKSFLIKNSTLTSANDDGDATIIIRSSAANAVLNIENTTINGTPDISGVTSDTTINRY